MALEEKLAEVANNNYYSAAYHRFLSDQRLMGAKCRQCGHVFLPPKPYCLECQQDEMELVEMKGRGNLVAYTVVNVAPPLMLGEGFGRDKPYCCGVVQLEEGPKITARILGVNVARPEEIKIGTPVTVHYVKVQHDGENKTFLAFTAHG